MAQNSYLNKVKELLLKYKDFKFSGINDLQFVVGLNFDPNTYQALADDLRKNGLKDISSSKEEEKSFEDVTIYKFSDEAGNHYLATVYDSDELWQDPELLDVIILKHH